MKKYSIFAISFIALFSILQLLSGVLLTLFYTPNIQDAWDSSGSLPQEVMISSGQIPFIPTLVIAFLSATIAYFIPKKFANHKEK